MSKMTAEHLKTGIIFGDNDTQEYVYLPPGEIGMEDEPICVLETVTGRVDVNMKEALLYIRKLSLKPVIHPYFGRRSY